MAAEILRNPLNRNLIVFSRGLVTATGATDAQADRSGQHAGYGEGARTGAWACIGTFSLQQPLHCTGVAHPGDPLRVPGDAKGTPDASIGMKTPTAETIRNATTRNTLYFITDDFSMPCIYLLSKRQLSFPVFWQFGDNNKLQPGCFKRKRDLREMVYYPVLNYWYTGTTRKRSRR